ncbi:MAG: hypothetical protein ACJ78V_04825 [Myxococcales bacterium]
MITRFRKIVELLSSHEIEFIVVGGLAAIVHGSPRLTQDVDVVYSRSAENLQRIVDALRPHEPYLRGAPPGLPFLWDARTLKNGLNFTLRTTLGDIDLLGEITGGGGYENLLPHSQELPMFGVRARVLDLDKLIEVKRAAGRPKDFETIAELEAIREELKGQ